MTPSDLNYISQVGGYFFFTLAYFLKKNLKTKKKTALSPGMNEIMLK